MSEYPTVKVESIRPVRPLSEPVGQFRGTERREETKHIWALAAECGR